MTAQPYTRIADTIFWTAGFLMVACLPFSIGPALSISAGLMALSFLFRIPSKPWKTVAYRPIYIAFLVLWLIALFSVLVSDDIGAWNAKVMLKLSIVLIMLGFVGFRMAVKPFVYLVLLFGTMITIVAIGTLVNYLLHYAEINEMIRHSRAIPIFGKTHHIHFSVMQALAIAFMAWVYAMRRKWSLPSWQSVTALVLAIVNFACMHALTTRTGLLAFYIGLFGLVVWIITSRKQYKLGAIVLAVMVVLPSLAYFVVPAFRNRVDNTMLDLSIAVNHKDNNFRSMGMRLEAWMNAWDIIKKHPLTGVGVGDAPAAMQQQYIENHTHLLPENRLDDTHNQFLQELCKAGYGVFLQLLRYLLFCSGTAACVHIR